MISLLASSSATEFVMIIVKLEIEVFTVKITEAKEKLVRPG